MGKSNKVRHAWRGTTRQTRLGPNDGIFPHPHERGLRTRDRSGQKLRDVVDPQTGFCTGVTGPMESDGTSVRPASPTSGTGEVLPTLDPDTGLWWVGNDRLVVRTTQTPDGPLTRTRIVKAGSPDFDPDMPTVQQIPKRGRKMRDQPERESSAGRRTPRTPRITDAEIRDYLAHKFGYRGNLTKQIRDAARAALVKQASVEAYSADLNKLRNADQ